MQYNGNNGGCGVPNGNIPAVQIYQPNYNCPSACAAPVGVPPNARVTQANSDCRIIIDVASSSVNRTMLFSGFSFSIDDNTAIMENSFFRVSPAVAAQPIIDNADTAEGRLIRLNMKVFMDTYIFNRVLVNVQAADGGEAQFRQGFNAYHYDFDINDGCANSIQGFSCPPCEGQFNLNVFDSCRLVVGKHDWLQYTVLAGNAVQFEMCVCEAGIAESYVSCAIPQAFIAPAPAPSTCPPYDQFVPNGQVVPNGQAAFANRY